jgi:hypothetical protein
MLPETNTIGFAEMTPAEMVVDRMGGVNAPAIGVLLQCRMWNWQQPLELTALDSTTLK